MRCHAGLPSSEALRQYLDLVADQWCQEAVVHTYALVLQISRMLSMRLCRVRA